MSYETILTDLSDGILTITMNRPQKLNATNGKLEEELDQALVAADADANVKVVILTGAGRGFCTGYDISQNPMPDDWRNLGVHGSIEMNRNGMLKHTAATLRIWNMSKPTIAAVNGYALGGGLEIAMACDIRYAAETALMGEPEIRHFSGAVTLLMPFLIPMGYVKELLLTGDTIGAAEAARIGLVNKVFPPEQLMDEARRTAKKLALIHPMALKLNKAALNRAYEMMGLMNAVNMNIELAGMHHAAAWSVNEDMFKMRTGSATDFIKAREAAFRELDRR